MPDCRIGLLGGFRVDVDGRPVPPEAWRRRRAAELVKLLALTPRHRLHRDELVEALWPDFAPGAGSANLRKAVHFARRSLGHEEAIGIEGGLVELWPRGGLAVDAEEFEREAADAVRDGDTGAASKAVATYGGDLLPEDLDAEWAHEPRQRLRRLFGHALRTAGMWERALQADPTDEEAHRGLMRAHLEAGNRQAAMRQFERLRDALHQELGVGPDPRSVALYEEILALEGTEPATPPERAAAHLAAGLVALNRMDLREAETQARVARDLAIEAGLGRELGQASGLLGMVAHSKGAWPDLFRQEFLDAIRAAPGLAGFVFDAHLCLAEFSLAGTEGPDRIAGYAGELLSLADRHRSIEGRALATLILGESKLLAGALDEAEADLSSAADLHREAGAITGEALSLERLAAAVLARGDRSRVPPLLERAEALATGSPLASHLVVRIRGTEVQAPQAAEDGAAIARSARAELAGQEVCEPCSMGFLVASTMAFARASRVEEAAQTLAQAERVAGMWQGGPWRAAVWEARAQVRLAEGEGRQAVALFTEAADLFAGVGHRLSEARCRAAAQAAEAATASNPSRNARGTPVS